MIYLKRKHIKEMIKHAFEEYPKEVCGILAGIDKRIKNIYKISNIEESSISYFGNSIEQFNIMKEIKRLGLKMYGIYHSHPRTLAYPSEKDIKLALYPEVLYFIISLQNFDNPVIKAFWIKNGKIKEEEIREEEEDGENF
jgi:proteasome lid subunit RPN8/RPN11